MAEQREHWQPVAGDAEAALVRRSQHGDLEAFGVLVRRHEGIVAALICQILDGAASPAEVEEIALTVFTLCWRDLPSLRDEARFPVWLTQRAVQAALRRPLSDDPASVDALPGLARAVVRLHYTGGHPLRRVAHLLGRSVSDVWALLYDGCRRLRETEARCTGPG